ncbi:hypothetical protein SOVF_144050 [Spinacia oleracea]|nr:hypothetical protein SOVF_144050 [Spinacia oleracea]
MSYRRRGGLNGRGAIIRPPGYRSNAQTSSHIIGEETPQLSNYGHEAEANTLNQVLNYRSNAATSMLHRVPNSVTHVASTIHHQAASNMNMAAANTAHQVPNTASQGPHQVPQTTPLHSADATHNREAITVVSDETGNPEKVDYVLHPDGLWFPHRVVVGKVSGTSYKTYFKGPYCNWKMTPPQVQQRWWNAFKHEFSWDPSVAKLVKKGWKSKIHHRQGSISTEEVRLKLAKKLGRPPTPSEVYFETHADSGGRFVNAKAEAVWNDYKNRKDANLQCEVENRRTDDELFLEATGGWSDKGRIFGLGAATDSFYERPEDRRTKKSRSDYAMEQKKELLETKENLAQTQENLAETQTKLTETQKQLDALHEQVRLIVQANNLSVTPTSTSSP